ncbi:MAG TPA: VF530 family protein [Oceanipulchritudo sp.]|nr:VF530 family protein [Oceanipulchritudo sp.]
MSEITSNDAGPAANQPNNPLHGITLEWMVTSLVDRYGWEELGQRIDIRCFNYDPSVKSSLKFLRRTPWARAKVEDLYLATFPNPQV